MMCILCIWQTEYLEFVKLGLVVLGVSCGLSNPMSSIYITEIAGLDNKGMVSSMFNFNLTLGILVTNVIGSLTGYRNLVNSFRTC